MDVKIKKSICKSTYKRIIYFVEYIFNKKNTSNHRYRPNVEFTRLCLRFMEEVMPTVVNTRYLSLNKTILNKYGYNYKVELHAKDVWARVFEPILMYCHDKMKQCRQDGYDLDDRKIPGDIRVHADLFDTACNCMSNIMLDSVGISHGFSECYMLAVRNMIQPEAGSIIINNLMNVLNAMKECEWKHTVRYIWIGFYKNDIKNNKKCYIYLLPKDIVKHLIKYLVNYNCKQQQETRNALKQCETTIQLILQMS